MDHPRVDISKNRIAEFCRRNHIRRLALFGSVLRDDFGPQSDVDVLVEFEPGARVGLLRLAGMEIELGEILGRKVDLNTPGFLSNYFRDHVLAEAQVQYDPTHLTVARNAINRSSRRMNPISTNTHRHPRLRRPAHVDLRWTHHIDRLRLLRVGRLRHRRRRHWRWRRHRPARIDDRRSAHLLATPRAKGRAVGDVRYASLADHRSFLIHRAYPPKRGRARKNQTPRFPLSHPTPLRYLCRSV